MKMKNNSLMALVGIAALAFSGACAQEIGDIDRSQPNALRKADLDGVWYFRPTIVETQYNQSAIFEGYEGEMEKIRWEIQEDALLGYRAYEKNPAADGSVGGGAEGLDEPGSNSPVVAFKVLKHFDIQRQYNPQTGIENNVLEENSTDKPWYERAYMRVDWSTNLIVNPFDIGSFASAYYADNQHSFDETYEDDPGRLRMSSDYIEFTVNVDLMVDLATCYQVFYDSVDWCGASEGKLRMSFRKVDDSVKYEPMEYPDYLPVQFRQRFRDNRSGLPCNPTDSQYQGTDFCRYDGICLADTTPEEDPFCRPELHDLYVSYDGYICDETFNPDDCYQYTVDIFARYGYFRTMRYLYDQERGYNLSGRQYLINRWNIWKKSFADDGTRIPYAERETKPVVYYTSAGFPENLRPSAQRFVDQWDIAFRQTVASLRGLEYDPKDIEDLYQKVPNRIFELRVNDCNPDNIKAYANAHDLVDVVERVAGDVDSINIGNIQRVCAALEFNSQDLDTPFTWQRHGDLRYAMINWVDTPQVAGPLGYGPLSADPETGEIVSATANIYGASLRTWTKRYADIIALMNGTLSESEVEGGEYVREAIAAARLKNQSLNAQQLSSLLDQVEGRLRNISQDSYLKEVPPGEHSARMRAAGDLPQAQQVLVSDEVLRAFAGPQLYQPGIGANAQALNAASPSQFVPGAPPQDFVADQHNQVDLQDIFTRDEKLSDFFALRNIMMPQFFREPAMIGLAFELQGKTRDEVHNYLMDVAFESVAGHEVGHTLGLRHNFEGSTDAMNFLPEFWAIKSLDLDPAVAMTQIDDVTWVAENKLAKMKQRLNRCVGSGLQTPECLRITEYMYSSIMDYGQRINHDISGLGLWDYAAIKFGYGQLLEAFDERDGAFLTDPYEMSYLLGLMGYEDIPKALSGVDMDSVFWDAYNAVSDAETQVVTLPDDVPKAYANIYRRRDVKFADFVDDYVRDLFVNGYTLKIREVPMAYCSDAFAWGGNLTCNRWDLGANVTEIVGNARELYDYYYLFNNFRNDRFVWGSIGSYLSRLNSRTFQPMKYAYNYYYYYRNSQARMWPMIQDWFHGAIDGLNFMGQILQTPEPGLHCLDSASNTYKLQLGDSCASGDSINIPLGAGRYYNSMWSNEYFYKPMVIGSFWDKILAIETMTDSSAYFYRNFSDVFDRGSFSITYYRVFTDEIIDLFMGLMNGNYQDISSTVQMVDGQPVVVPRAVVGGEIPAGAPSIEPGHDYFLNFYAMYNALFGLTSTVDRSLDFMDRARIHLVGEVNEPSYDGFAANELITFMDPHTGYTYRAAPVDAVRDLGTGEIIDTRRSIGYRFLLGANELLSSHWQPAEDAYTAAQQACDADSDCSAAQPDNTHWQALLTAEAVFVKEDRKLTEMVESLDVMRMFVNLMPYSSL